MPRIGREIFTASVDTPDRQTERAHPYVDLKEVLLALADVIHRTEMFASHHVQREPLSVRERMSQVLATLSNDHFTEFTTLFRVEEVGRRGVVVTFMAVLELISRP